MAVVARVETTVVTRTGAVRGTREGAVAVWRGVPYAQQPVGARRFMAPGPLPSWEGVRDATRHGPLPPQGKTFVGAGRDDPKHRDEACLTLTVWSPDPGAALPVMVWIPGGAFVFGAGQFQLYNGSRLAANGNVVVVNVTYRIGVFGGFELGSLGEGFDDNLCLRDQIAALEWVRDNIAAFGGDPSQVTIFGESAGAMSVASLLSSPLAQGLFGRAIMQSGNGSAAVAVEDARKVTARVAGLLGVTPDVAGLGSVDGAALLKAQTDMAMEMMLNPDPEIFGATVVATGMGIMSTIPVVDGDVLPNLPVASIAAGAGAGVPLITGWNADEFRFFLVPTGVAGNATPEFARGMLRSNPQAVRVFDDHLAEGATAGDALCMTLTEVAFRAGSLQLAQLRPDEQTYLYEFGVPNEPANIGAGHAVEIPYVFDHLADAERLTGPDAPQAVADAMHGAWVAFAKTGDPGWAPYLSQDTVQRFD